MATHIVWDWNGTLLADTPAVLDSTNAALAAVGAAPVSLRRYRASFRVPLVDFYREAVGRALSEAEWEAANTAFIRDYDSRVGGVRLRDGAAALLDGCRRSGLSQSLLSMHGHDKLLPTVRGFGIDDYFVRIDGRVGDIERKAEHLERHLAAMAEAGHPVSARDVVLIGDVLDDARAALHVGARAVLHCGGCQDRERLLRAGVPVVDTLDQAVRLAHAAG